MKITMVFLAFLVTTSISFSQAAQPKVFSKKWLEDGCSQLVLLTSSDSGKSDAAGLQSAQEVAALITGYLNGVKSVGAMTDQPPKMSQVPDRWLKLEYSAPRLLSFLRCGYIPEKTPAQIIIAAWYLTDHPSSTDTEKAVAWRLLDEYNQ